MNTSESTPGARRGIERFEGHALPGGTYTVDPSKHALFLEAVAAEPSPAGNAHPMFCFIAAHNGMGLTFPQFMDLLEAPLDAGALFGQEDLHIVRPLKIGETVSVRGTIVEAVTKHGAKTGSFDRVTCGLELVDATGAVICTSRETYIIPRKAP
jgi:acyl dehydratase